MSHATDLARAANDRTLIEQPSRRDPRLTEAAAYRVQAELYRMRRGADVGFKMGLTSVAKMRQMNIDAPICGFLTAPMIAHDGATIPRSHFVQPRVEAELAFVLRRPLTGPVTTAEAMDAVGGVAVAIEILDSRYRDFSFALPDVIADNTSASRFVLGSEVRSPTLLPVGNTGVVLEINGAPVAVASSAAVLGHPARSLAMLLDLLEQYYPPGMRTLPQGAIILTGGITEAFAVDAGDRVRVRADGLGSASFTMGGPNDSPPPAFYTVGA
jgi:2-oxo-3-hexenedioate decarboxylase